MATLGTFTAGQVLTAAELNAIGTWTSYTPILKVGANTVTTPNVSGRYTVVNDIVMLSAYFGPDMSFSGSGNISLTIPAAASVAAPLSNTRMGFGNLWNGAASSGFEVSAYTTSFTTFGFIGAGFGVMSNTSPMTWSSSTEFYFFLIAEKL